MQSQSLLRVFIGYDPVETVAWHTFAHSILRQSSIPVALVPVNIRNLGGIFTRPRDAKQSNEFSFTRFLVPHLSGYTGLSVFFDCDMLLRCDIAELLEVPKQQPGKAVYVVKHDYQPRDDIKYLNTVQYRYPRKNWSSVILFNCAHPSNRVLTPDFVNNATGREFHTFTWLQDSEIGDLSPGWNFLVGHTKHNIKPRLMHFTDGGPWFDHMRDIPFAGWWTNEYDYMMKTRGRFE